MFPEEITLQIQKYTLKFEFQHYHKIHMPSRKRFGTVCHFYFNKDLMGVGAAICCPTDLYDQGVGRYYSLWRALVDADIDEPWWSRIWEKYIDLYGEDEYNRVMKKVGQGA